MIDELFYIIMGFLCASCALCLYRLVKGPSLADALMALNALTTVGIGIVIVLGVQHHELFINAAIPLALIAFVSTLVVCKYLEGGIRVEH